MTFTYESRCLICDYFWISSVCTSPCPNCGETDDIYSEEKELMMVTEALQFIVKNEQVPALNYCIGYAQHALFLANIEQSDYSSVKEELKTQLLYVLNNMTHWRQDLLTSPTTAAEIKECRAVLKKASV